jgi:hypothetical protein
LREHLKAQGYVFATQTDTEVIAHSSMHWHAPAAATCAGGAGSDRGVPRGLRDRGHIDARTRARGRRAAGQSAGGRLRRPRLLPCLRCRGPAIGHAPGGLPGGRGRRRHTAGRLCDLRRARRAGRAHAGHHRIQPTRSSSATATSCRRRSSSSCARCRYAGG